MAPTQFRNLSPLYCPSCSNDVPYTNNILRDVLIKGLADHEIQLDLLGDTNQDMSLEEVFRFVEAKEAGKRSAGRLLLILRPAWARKECPYKNQKSRVSSVCCGYCGKSNHRTIVCRSKDKQQPPQAHPPSPGEAESGVFDSLCTATTSAPQPTQNTDAIQLDHHLYHSLSERWVQKPSQPQPFLVLAATAHPDNYRTLGFKPVTSQPRTAKLTAMADTGCQSCLVGMKVMHLLGLCKSDLIPVTLSIHAANKMASRSLVP